MYPSNSAIFAGTIWDNYIDNQITIDLINHCIFESAPRGMATEEPRQVRNGMEKIYPKKTRFSIEVIHAMNGMQDGKVWDKSRLCLDWGGRSPFQGDQLIFPIKSAIPKKRP